MLIVPLVGCTSRVRLLKVVLLPAPFTPSSAKHSPLLRAKERSLTASNDVALHGIFDWGTLYTFFRFFTETES